MIKVIIKRKNNQIESIRCNGHANHDEYGKDIVCSSFSTMLITTVNAILEFDKEAISYTNTNNMEIINIKKDNITNKLLDNLVNLMIELSSQYKDNINIKEEDND